MKNLLQCIAGGFLFSGAVLVCPLASRTSATGSTTSFFAPLAMTAN